MIVICAGGCGLPGTGGRRRRSSRRPIRRSRRRRLATSRDGRTPAAATTCWRIPQCRRVTRPGKADRGTGANTVQARARPRRLSRTSCIASRSRIAGPGEVVDSEEIKADDSRRAAGSGESSMLPAKFGLPLSLLTYDAGLQQPTELGALCAVGDWSDLRRRRDLVSTIRTAG